jgi:tetratricopeptide (TPR) repeat protein
MFNFLKINQMKKLIVTLVLVSLFSAAFSGEAYEKAMHQSIDQLYQAKSIPEYVEVANQFERISSLEKGEWMPLYYASFAYIMISFQEPENAKKDQFLDQAQKYLDQAMAIDPNESELYLLQGFLYPSRINVDPMNRGMKYMEVMNKSLDKAQELNPNNPRVYYLRATMMHHTPEAYGGGAAKALPLYLTADEKFRVFKPKTAISPNWGKEINDAGLKEVQEILKK